MFPILDEKCFIGALWDPIEGHLDPSGTTHAYAKAARIAGAEICCGTPRSRSWCRPRTVPGTSSPSKGTIRRPNMSSMPAVCGRARCGRMVGIELPVLAMEHMYLLTDEMPEVVAFNEATGRELIGVLDFGGEIYTRQEGKGMLLGTYEQACRPWSPVKRRGISGTSCCSPTSTGWPRSWRSALSISRRCKMPASSRSSTARSPSHRTAIRWSGR
jgi:dimethylglycine dehydrogenase